jgi:signal transduction histidine kinase
VRAGTLAMDAPVDVTAAAEAVLARLGRPAEELRWLPNPTEAGPQNGYPGTVLPRANALLIDRLIFNLVDNALTHGTAPVVVRTAVGPDGIVIDVADAGAGLPAGQETTLLQAFARADASRHVPGSGLGLTVVQQIVVRLGGTLVFEHDAAGHRARVALPVGPRPDV